MSPLFVRNDEADPYEKGEIWESRIPEYRVKGSEGKKTMRNAVLIAILAIGGGVLAQLYVRTLVYHPTIEVDTPDGFKLTVVQTPTHDRQKCGAANDRFLKPVLQLCPKCRVAYARCYHRLNGFERAIVEKYVSPFYLVLAPGVHMAISGPKAQLRAVCDQIAANLVGRGFPNAACVYPRAPRS